MYRLVVRKSVEERMVSRAHRKLFLNEMVAEKAPAGEQKVRKSAGRHRCYGSSLEAVGGASRD